MRAVLDTGVVVAGIFWHREPYQCLVAFGRRRFSMVISEEILREYAVIARRLKQEDGLPVNPGPWLDFIRTKATLVEPVPWQNQVCRDPKDDKFLECAVAAGADYIVSRDNDLLVLQKPFGVEVVTPRKFLSLLTAQGRKK